VLATLLADPRFAHDGRTHGSRWRLNASGRNGTEWDGMSLAPPAPRPPAHAQGLYGAYNRLNGAP
jgi:hypothetical protein